MEGENWSWIREMVNAVKIVVIVTRICLLVINWLNHIKIKKI